MSNNPYVYSLSFLTMLLGFFLCGGALAIRDLPKTSDIERQPDITLYQWWQTVDIEHEGRKNRLKRLANVMPSLRLPRYYEEVIPKHKLDNLLDGIPLQGIPVLRVVFEDKVFFDTDDSRIRGDAQLVIDLIAESLRREPPDVAVFVAGHADSRGSEDYNHNLSVDRADTVARALVDRGIGRVAVWRIGFGESVPIAPNSTVEGMAKNRRVEFLFAAKPAAIAVWLSQQKADPCIGKSTSDAQRCKLKIRKQFQATPVLKDKEKVVVAPPSIKNSGTNVALPNPEEKKLPESGETQVAPVIKDKEEVVAPSPDTATPNTDVALPNSEEKKVPEATVETVSVDIKRTDFLVIDLENKTYSIPEPQA